jgi:hypothetical protein
VEHGAADTVTLVRREVRRQLDASPAYRMVAADVGEADRRIESSRLVSLAAKSMPSE